MYQGSLSKLRSQVVGSHSSSSLTHEVDVRGSNRGPAGVLENSINRDGMQDDKNFNGGTMQD